MRIVIFRIAFIGDTMIALPLLRELREKYQNDHITYIGNPVTLPLVQAWGLADEVMAQDSSLSIELYSDGLRTPHWLDLFRQADLAISLMRNRTDELVRNLYHAGVKEVIAADEFQTGTTSKHGLELLAESIGIDSLDAGNVAPFRLKDNDFTLVNSPVTIHPGRGKDDGRCWRAASYATLITRLIRNRQPVVLLVGPDDVEQLKDVLKHLPSSISPGMMSVMKNAPIVEVVKVMEKSKCYLGTDCGMTHLAALTGVPVIALFGPIYPLPPLGPRVELIRDRLERLSVDRVLVSMQKYV
ncbi:MAG TPA: glycosyltransferase family 9 protein [Ktedonobacteraceae bacterium]|nr:glycosyltransferase family 9 protein [Ktedonobacteraceae bacterium]